MSTPPVESQTGDPVATAGVNVVLNSAAQSRRGTTTAEPIETTPPSHQGTTTEQTAGPARAPVDTAQESSSSSSATSRSASPLPANRQMTVPATTAAARLASSSSDLPPPRQVTMANVQPVAGGNQVDQAIVTTVDDLHSSGTLEPWLASFWSCFTPVDDCFVTCFCPCFTFGRAWTRENEDPTMQRYHIVNVPCVGQTLMYNFWLGFLPPMILRARMRQTHGLVGNPVIDCLASCFCHPCTLVQMEKESRLRAEARARSQVTREQPVSQQIKMEYGPA